MTITENRFERDESPITVHATDGGEDVAVTGNQIVAEPGSVALAHIDRLTVADNTITGGSGSGIALGGDGLSNADVVRNTITGEAGTEANGIRLTNWAAKPDERQNDNVTIAQNTITGITSSTSARGNGIWIRDVGARGTVVITHNRIVDNSGAGLRNEDSDAVVDARENWWGCNSGPGFAGCDAVTRPDGTPPVVMPWLLLSLTALPVQVAAGASSTLVADVANRSSGGVAAGPFFLTGQATFGSTPAGSHSPPTVPLDATLHAQSAFTAGAVAPTELRTTVDHQTVRIAISDPARARRGTGRPADRPTVTPGGVLGSTVRLVNQGSRTARGTRACLRLSPKLRRLGVACRTIARLRPGHSVVYRVLARARQDACAGRLPCG